MFSCYSWKSMPLKWTYKPLLVAGGTETEPLEFLDIFLLTVRTQRRKKESILSGSYKRRSSVSQGSLSTIKRVGVCVCIHFTAWRKQCDISFWCVCVYVCVGGGVL